MPLTSEALHREDLIVWFAIVQKGHVRLAQSVLHTLSWTPKQVSESRVRAV